MGTPQAPSVLIVLRVRPRRPTPLGAVSLPVWSFADQTWSRGQLRCLRAIPLEVPLLSTVVASPSLSTWAPLGIFLRLFKNVFHSHGEGFHVLAVVNSAAKNVGTHVSSRTCFFLGYTPRSIIAGSYVSFIFSFYKGPTYCSP